MIRHNKIEKFHLSLVSEIPVYVFIGDFANNVRSITGIQQNSKTLFVYSKDIYVQIYVVSSKDCVKHVISNISKLHNENVDIEIFYDFYYENIFNFFICSVYRKIFAYDEYDLHNLQKKIRLPQDMKVITDVIEKYKIVRKLSYNSLTDSETKYLVDDNE